MDEHNGSISREKISKVFEITTHQNISLSDWFLGGNSGFCAFFGHRVERDITVGLSNMSLLSLLTPRLNEWIRN